MAQNGSKAKSSRHFAAGLGSGVASAVLLQPLDLLKTRVQQSGQHRSLSSHLREAVSSPTAFRSLWRGTLPSALRTGFGSALYFTSLNAIRQHVSRTTNRLQAGLSQSHSSALPTLSNSANMLAGAGARTFAGLVLMPLTVIKVRYESNLYSYRSILGASRDIYATGGLRGFFSGFGATAVRDAPYAGMYVLFYEMLKKRFSAMATRPSTPNPSPPGASSGSASSEAAAAVSSPPKSLTTSQATAVNFTSGSLAAAACAVVSNPFDAVKTRIQLRPRDYRNMWQAGRRMLAEEGTRSLFDGLALRMSRKALSSALAWTVYEELLRRAERTWSANVGVGGMLK